MPWFTVSRTQADWKRKDISSLSIITNTLSLATMPERVILSALERAGADESGKNRILDLKKKRLCILESKVKKGFLHEYAPLPDDEALFADRVQMDMVVKLASGFTLAEPLNGWEESQESYAAGKEYIECGRTTSGLLHLADAAVLDPWCEVQLALLYQYQLHDTESCRNHLRHATERGYRPAEEILRRIDAGQFAYILGNLVSLVYHAGRVFADEVEDGYGPLVPTPYDGIDSKIRREQWAKDHGVNPTMG